jgi:hypothetical protein
MLMCRVLRWFTINVNSIRLVETVLDAVCDWIVFLLVEKDSLSSAVQIVVLATVHRPEERNEPQGSHSERERHEPY